MHKIILGKFLVTMGLVSVLATQFSVDSSKFSFTSDSKKNSITKNINKNYELSHSISSSESKLDKEIKELTKKSTYLLLGSANNINESSKDYYKRHKEYLKLRYKPKIPKDSSTFTGYDEDSKEYQDDLLSGISIPSMFLVLDELNIVYGSLGNIRVAQTDEFVMSTIALPNVTMREENAINPMKYDNIRTNLVIYYFFKQLEGEYKLLYIMAETSDTLDGYFGEIESGESKGAMQMAVSYDSKLKEVYNFDKLDNMTVQQKENIQEMNEKNTISFNSYYNNRLVASANGFYINDGLVVTTWNFMKKSLTEAEYVTAKDYKGNRCEIEGIVVVNQETDVVVLKMKEKVGHKVKLGDSKKLKIEDPVLTISSKTGVGLSFQGGVVVANKDYIESALPLTEADEGSLLLNDSGNVVGMNTAKQVNTSVSMAINSGVLKEIQDKFDKIPFKDVKAISFDKLKAEYYYVKYNKEKVDKTIPKSKWKTYSKIGNIEKNISLKLVKSSYQDGIVSLRYYNGITDFISSMQMAAGYKEQLIKDGYKEKLSTSNKCVYQNKEYKVIIMSEFNYLIVVMVKL